MHIRSSVIHCNLYHQQRQIFYALVYNIVPQFTNLDVSSKIDIKLLNILLNLLSHAMM